MFPSRMCCKYARVVDLSLQACSNVTLGDVAMFGECCPFFESPCLGFGIWCCISVLFLEDVTKWLDEGSPVDIIYLDF